MTSWITILLSCVLLLATTQIARIFIFSPLRKIPGPKLAALSDLWMLHRTLKYEAVIAIEESFKKYGNIIRMGPNTVLVRGGEDLRQIYGGHKYLKDEKVSRARFYDTINITAAIDPAVHGRLRKMTNSLFTNSSLKTLRKPLLETLDNLHMIINKSIQNTEPVDMWRIYRLFAFDFIGYAAFGQSFDALKTGKDHDFLIDLDKTVTMLAVRMGAAPWLFNLIQKIPIPAWQDILGSEDRLFEFGRKMVLNHSAPPDPERYDMIAQLYNAEDPETGETLSERSIISNVLIYIIGGTDTTGTQLSWITWALARYPHVYSRLREELDAAVPDPLVLPEMSALRRLPYLHAVIKEAMRRWPAGSFVLRRIVPSGGAVHQGYFIPEKTSIGCNPYSAHRNEDYFPNPEKYDPERWLEVVDGVTKLKDTTNMPSFMAWSTGVRSCQGQPFAEMEMYSVIASLVRRYRIKPDITTTDKSMADTDLMILTPKSHKVSLTFEECL